MATEERKLNTKKYFIHKIGEYFKNTNQSLHTKRSDSIRSMLEDYIEIQHEISQEHGEVSRLEKSQAYLLKGIKFSLDNPLFNHSLFQRDITVLHDHIKTSKGKNDDDQIVTIDRLKVYHSITSLLKKFKKNNGSILKAHLDILTSQHAYALSYGEVDKLIDSFVNELIYEGYSLHYLKQWWDQLNKYDDNIDNVLSQFKYLDGRKNEYTVEFECWLPKVLGEEIVTNGYIKLNDLDFKYVSRNNQQNYEAFYHLEVKITACDMYKAVENATVTLDDYLEPYKNKVGFKRSAIKIDNCFVYDSERIELRRDQLRNMINLEEPNEREKEDTDDFLNLRNEFRKKGKIPADILILEKAHNLTSKTLHPISKENRLLNMWSALEYLLSSYPRNSIIEKVRVIVPKVICLYLIKGKMNILWNRLAEYRRKHEFPSFDFYYVIHKMFQECSYEKGKKIWYDRGNFARFLTSEYAQILHDEFAFHVVIQREIAELNFLLSKPEQTKKAIITMHERIENDFNRIYRIRNKLVHSGHNIPENIELFTGRLNLYVRSLLGTLTHHIKRSPELSIVEILYAITETYDWYIGLLSSTKSFDHRIVLPEYLFV